MNWTAEVHIVVGALELCSSATFLTASGANPVFSPVVLRALSLGVKQPEYETDHSLTCI